LAFWSGSVSLVTIFNKRNAFIGWVVLELAKHKARATSTRTRVSAGTAAALAAAGGVLLFWRKSRNGDE
jgi:hypothetical protein